MNNPYGLRHETNGLEQSLVTQRQRWPTVQSVLYTHLMCIASAAGLSYMDTQRIQLPTIVEFALIPLALVLSFPY